MLDRKRRYPIGFVAFAVALIGLFPVGASATEEPQIVKDIFAGANGSIPLVTEGIQFGQILASAGGTLFFAADDGTSGSELWKSDGTPAGTVRVKDIFPGPSSGLLPFFYGPSDKAIDFGGTLYFVANDGTHGRELWRSDGTEAGTFMVKDVLPGLGGSGSSFTEYLVPIGQTLLFTAFDGGINLGIWRSDGTEAGTVFVKRLGFPRDLINVGGTVFFVASDPNDPFSGRELWRTDGTDVGTVRVKDIRPGAGSSDPDSFIAVGGTLFFRADDGSGRALWRSDGTEAGTKLVKHVIVAAPHGGIACASAPVSQLVNFGGTLLFAAEDATNGLELWRSDGTEAGTFRVKDIAPGPGHSFPSCLVVSGGTLFFGATDGTNGHELWRSDGTEAGTFMVKDIIPGSGSPGVHFLVDGGGTLFFAASGASGIEVWKSDGTEAGTLPAGNIGPGTSSSIPQSLIVVGGTLFFSADDGSGGREPWMIALNSAPIADAGPDQTVGEGAAVALDGTASTDPNGDALNYAWEQIGGPAVILSDPAAAQPGFVAPTVPSGGATLTFRLTVDDGTEASEPDTVDVTVKNVNKPPVADAGDDQTVLEGSPVTLHGGDSFDPDSEPLVYMWLQTAGPAVALSDPGAVEPSFLAPPVGTAGETLVFVLTVSDGIDLSTDDVVIAVTNVNQIPIADAGPDQTLGEGKAVTLDGTASSDPDADPLTWAWTQIGGPPVALSDPGSATPTFTAPVVGQGGDSLVFQLVVSDGAAASEPDAVTIYVLDTNQPPVCDLAQPSLGLLWPPNHKLVAVGITGIADPEDPDVQITITAVTQDEPVDGLGDGDTSPDAVLQGSSVLLRSERAGNGTGRVYAAAFMAQDASGATCTGSVTVCVPHDRRDDACVDEGQVYDSLLP